MGSHTSSEKLPSEGNLSDDEDDVQVHFVNFSLLNVSLIDKFTKYELVREKSKIPENW
jgi:hypothetical protein